MNPNAPLTPRNYQSLLTYTATNNEASGEIATHGAHLLHWQPRGFNDVLWLSSQSHFQKGKAIRGGVPICFPWFGPKADDADAPMHGLARTLNWKLKSSQQFDDRSELVFVPDERMKAQENWPREWEIEMRFSIGAQLEMEFWVQNNGASTCEYEIALHTYFAVGDVRQCEISGLENVAFYDKVAQTQRDGESGPIHINGETDRVYQSAGTCTVRDGAWKREIAIAKGGSQSTIVWNPWVDKAAKMADFGDDEWSQMLCIETANVGEKRVRLKAGEQHSTIARIDVREL